MIDEKLCRTCKERFAPADQSSCWGCRDNSSYVSDGTDRVFVSAKRMTNYEQIISMSVEEMAEFLDAITDACSDIGGGYHCNKCPIGLIGAACDIRRWLESEADT